MEQDAVDNLIADLLEWIGPDARPYDEVMAAWRTSCPHLPVWEEADERGFLHRHRGANGISMLSVTDAGWAYHRARRKNQ